MKSAKKKFSNSQEKYLIQNTFLVSLEAGERIKIVFLSISLEPFDPIKSRIIRSQEFDFLHYRDISK